MEGVRPTVLAGSCLRKVVLTAEQRIDSRPGEDWHSGLLGEHQATVREESV